MGTWSNNHLRGNILEEYINHTNQLYASKNLALIQKIPTPIKPVNLNPQRGVITLAYFEQKSTVDYVGVAQGVPICFDAKETKLKNLPLNNIHQHQVEHMRMWEKQGGISFLLVNFVEEKKYFYLPLEDLLMYYDNKDNGGRKSIPYKAFTREIPIENGYLHYLKSLQQYLNEKKQRIAQ